MYIGATLGATTGVGTGATTGAGKQLCNSLIIKLGVRGVTKRQKNIVEDRGRQNNIKKKSARKRKSFRTFAAR